MSIGIIINKLKINNQPVVDDLNLVQPEHYKGIEYVRLSSLPAEHMSKIREQYKHDNIIKIMKDNRFISDCILYTDYMKWYQEHHSSKI